MTRPKGGAGAGGAPITTRRESRKRCRSASPRRQQRLDAGEFLAGAARPRGGILGGLAGLSGPLPTLWASVRGWTKDQRRGVFQIFNGTVLGAALILQSATGFVKLNVLLLAPLAMPGTLIGARLGMRTYHALNDRNFYDVVLALLFLSGLGLVWSSIAPR